MFKMFSFFSTFTFLVLLLQILLSMFRIYERWTKIRFNLTVWANVKNEITLWNCLEQTIITILNCN